MFTENVIYKIVGRIIAIQQMPGGYFFYSFLSITNQIKQGGFMKKLEVFMTSNLQQQIDPDLTCSILALVIPLFAQYLYDMFVIEPGKNSKLRIRLAGYNFDDQTLDEETIVANTDLPGERVIWFKIDDYGDRYIGTLLLPEDY